MAAHKQQDIRGVFNKRMREFFDAPGPMPEWKRPARTDAARALRQDALHDWAMRDMIYRATLRNDPGARADLARRLGDDIFAGRALTPASRRWLAWALAELATTDRVPHLARGNAVKPEIRFERTRQLVEFMRRAPAGDIVDRLEKASKTLGVSYSAVRKLYYSELFRGMASTELPAK